MKIKLEMAKEERSHYMNKFLEVEKLLGIEKAKLAQALRVQENMEVLIKKLEAKVALIEGEAYKAEVIKCHKNTLEYRNDLIPIWKKSFRLAIEHTKRWITSKGYKHHVNEIPMFVTKEFPCFEAENKEAEGGAQEN